MTSAKEPLRNSMASKKKAALKLKNVLAQPLPRYWPEINEHDCEELKQCLMNTIEKAGKNSPLDVGVNLGIASCLRLLNRRGASCVLLSSEIKPKFITTQIIYSVISKNDGVAVLCVPNLKKITGETFKIQSLVLTVPKGKQSNIEQWIRVKSSSFPLPKKLAAYYTPENSLEKPMDTCDISKTSNKGQEESEMIDLSQLYLTRSSHGRRAFLPKNSKDVVPVLKESKAWPDYISFSSHTSSVVKMEVDDCDRKVESNKSRKKSLQSCKKLDTSCKSFSKGGKTTCNELFNQIVPKIASDTKLGKGNSLQQKQEKKNKRKNHSKNKQNNSVSNYISLKVSKIQGNPDKKRKKRNKKK